MPLYEYRCLKCGHQFERIQKFSDEILTECPECDGRLEKLLSPPAIVFKGTGWYVTDYARKGNNSQEKGKGTKISSPEKVTSQKKDCDTAVSSQTN